MTCAGRISIHAPRTGSDLTLSRDGRKMSISIHAPRTGSDRVSRQGNRRKNISIHAPRTGSDGVGVAKVAVIADNFNPRSPHGERLSLACDVLASFWISIHAPRTGSDGITHYMGVAEAISIHAPRTGSDRRKIAPSADGGKNFNPRSPHGERPLVIPPLFG